VCSLSSGMQCACAILSSVACQPYHIFHSIAETEQFYKNKLLNVKCVLSFSTTFVWNISHSKQNWATYNQNCISVFVYIQCPPRALRSEFNESWIFWTRFPKNLIKIGPVGEELFYADGQTWRSNRRFSQIATASKNYFHQPGHFCHMGCVLVDICQEGNGKGKPWEC